MPPFGSKAPTNTTTTTTTTTSRPLSLIIIVVLVTWLWCPSAGSWAAHLEEEEEGGHQRQDKTESPDSELYFIHAEAWQDIYGFNEHGPGWIEPTYRTATRWPVYIDEARMPLYFRYIQPWLNPAKWNITEPPFLEDVPETLDKMPTTAEPKFPIREEPARRQGPSSWSSSSSSSTTTRPRPPMPPTTPRLMKPRGVRRRRRSQSRLVQQTSGRTVSRHKRIVGGLLDVKWEDFQQTMALMTRNDRRFEWEVRNLKVLCSGVLVTKHHLLTDERCVRERVLGVDDWKMEVRVGSVVWNWANGDTDRYLLLQGGNSRPAPGEAAHMHRIMRLCMDPAPVSDDPDRIVVAYMERPDWHQDQSAALLPLPPILDLGVFDHYYIHSFGAINETRNDYAKKSYVLPVARPFAGHKCGSLQDPGQTEPHPSRYCTTSSLRGLGTTCANYGDGGAPLYGRSRSNRNIVFGLVTDQVDQNCSLWVDPFKKELLTIYAIDLFAKIRSGALYRALEQDKCGFQATTRASKPRPTRPPTTPRTPTQPSKCFICSPDYE